MITFRLNGNEVSGESTTKLLPFLREFCGLTSVKNGCETGVCGTCTVLVNGIKKRSCLMTLSQVEHCDVVTVEGLSGREREVYAYAFGKSGAVQCGFCIPGMVLSAKALLDVNPAPSRSQIKQAIRGNLCRCTGYVKIEEAINLAAKILREGSEIPEARVEGRVGDRLVRVDAREKILGEALFCDDVRVDGMLYASVLRAAYPRATVISIDTSIAKQSPGVHAVLTAADIPGEVYDGYLKLDWPAMIPIGEQTRYVGDAIALVAADTKAEADAAVERIAVQYEPLKPLTDPFESIQPNAPAIHQDGNIAAELHIVRGELEDALEQSYITINQRFTTPFTEHAFLEPESALAYYDDLGILNVHVGTQNIHHDAQGLSRILGIPLEKIRVKVQFIGGAFGGKEDLSVQHHAALLAQSTRRPVKLTLSREESMRVHPKRHPMTIDLVLGADANGRFTGLKSTIVADTGAYASLGPGVMRRAVTHSCGPYKMPNIDLRGYAVYTNNPPSGAFRGFGVSQSAFAIETAVDMIAEKLNMDRFDIRLLNALRPGDAMSTGQLCTDDTAYEETLLAVKDSYDLAISQGKIVGIASAIKNSGVGMGSPDTGRASLVIEQGKIRLYSAAICIGQGLATVLAQIAAEVIGVEAGDIEIMAPDTFYTVDTGATTGSRQTVISGEAVRKAAMMLRDDLGQYSLSELEGHRYDGEYSPKTHPLDAPGIEHPKNHVAFSYATNLAVLNEAGKVERIVAAFDVGRAINPLNVEGQIEGGIVMGMGYALTENFIVEDGYVKSKFGTLGLLRATDVPEIETIIIEKGAGEESFAAKGVGEIATIPAAPAISSAYNYVNGVFETQLPLKLTPYNKKKAR